MAKRAKLEVTLPCCPECHSVGKVLLDSYSGKVYCVGRNGEMHKRRRMQPLRFRSVEPAP